MNRKDWNEDVALSGCVVDDHSAAVSGGSPLIHPLRPLPPVCILKSADRSMAHLTSSGLKFFSIPPSRVDSPEIERLLIEHVAIRISPAPVQKASI